MRAPDQHRMPRAAAVAGAREHLRAGASPPAGPPPGGHPWGVDQPDQDGVRLGHRRPAVTRRPRHRCPGRRPGSGAATGRSDAPIPSGLTRPRRTGRPPREPARRPAPPTPRSRPGTGWHPPSRSTCAARWTQVVPSGSRSNALGPSHPAPGTGGQQQPGPLVRVVGAFHEEVVGALHEEVVGALHEEVVGALHEEPLCPPKPADRRRGGPALETKPSDRLSRRARRLIPQGTAS